MEAFWVLAIVLVACISISQAASTNPPVQGLFVFGDSALDGGQNTYIPGSKIVSAIPPYGKTYFSKPTGRWTDGRTIADFLAQALGLPLLPPFLEPGANFSSGVNFASAGAGLLDETNAHQGVISMKQQLRQFRNVTNEYKKEKGVEFTNQLLRNSVALFSMGANDIANAVPSSFLFQEMIQAYSSAIQEIYNYGIKHIIILLAPPIGCTPNLRAVSAQSRNTNLTPEGCIGIINTFVDSYNTKLLNLAVKLHNDYRDLNIATLNPSPIILNVLRNPQKYGFKEAEKACCGGGPFNAAEFCGDADKHDWKPDHKNKYTKFICNNPEDYLYFDSNHFTEAGYWFVMKNFWHGSYNIARPSNLNFFFQGFNIPNPPPTP
ncbi:hypothetical protein SELMODRAFT_408115 [Selaginella moellendorffii]|uniref:SGNH hydrolase-type esterase domain-containing protein n=1 Tax=Selaginella moellendorffii TaxID=88036 RepID=D8R786_SELML|nr:hypothetical protein SELMODRAFT_408115 [Selaginella moellendorffii]